MSRNLLANLEKNRVWGLRGSGGPFLKISYWTYYLIDISPVNQSFDFANFRKLYVLWCPGFLCDLQKPLHHKTITQQHLTVFLSKKYSHHFPTMEMCNSNKRTTDMFEQMPTQIVHSAWKYFNESRGIKDHQFCYQTGRGNAWTMGLFFEEQEVPHFPTTKMQTSKTEFTNKSLELCGIGWAASKMHLVHKLSVIVSATTASANFHGCVSVGHQRKAFPWYEPDSLHTEKRDN